MKNLILLAVILCSISCSTDEDTPTGTPESQEYFYQEDKSISVVAEENFTITSVVDGENLVFTYAFIGAQEDFIADDEYSEFIRFEIDPSLESFSFANDDLEAITAYFRISCFCDGHSYPITGGTINGTKISDASWDIDIDVTFEQFQETESRTISGRFTLRE